jgi:hypothetical protein
MLQIYYFIFYLQIFFALIYTEFSSAAKAANGTPPQKM